MNGLSGIGGESTDADLARSLLQLRESLGKKQRTGEGPQDGATPIDRNGNDVDAKTSGVFTSMMGVMQTMVQRPLLLLR